MSENMKSWRRIDATNRPRHIEEDDRCHFFMDYQARALASSSEANQLINNFKKDPKWRGQPPWKYKLIAVDTFAKDLISLFTGKENLTLAFIPGSKAKDDKAYDERFDLLAYRLRQLRPSLNFAEPITIKSSRDAVHASSNRLSPLTIKKTYRWHGFNGTQPKRLILIDDVITEGAQFRAYKDTVLSHHDDMRVVGVFWGKTFWPNDFEGF